MPATIVTKESFPPDTKEDRLKEEVELRLRATAIKSWYVKTKDGFDLFTEWNVIGEQ